MCRRDRMRMRACVGWQVVARQASAAAADDLARRLLAQWDADAKRTERRWNVACDLHTRGIITREQGRNLMLGLPWQ